MSNVRVYTGSALVLTACIVPFLGVPLITMSPLNAGIKATLITITVAGLPEILLILAGVFMGKENLKLLMGKIMAPFKTIWRKLSGK